MNKLHNIDVINNTYVKVLDNGSQILAYDELELPNTVYYKPLPEDYKNYVYGSLVADIFYSYYCLLDIRKEHNYYVLGDFLKYVRGGGDYNYAYTYLIWYKRKKYYVSFITGIRAYDYYESWNFDIIKMRKLLAHKKDVLRNIFGGGLYGV